MPRRLLGLLARPAVVAVGGAVLLLGSAGSASAHVGITPSSAAAGSYSVLTLSVPHGCAGSPTTAVRIQVPEEITSVTPTRNAQWDVVKETVAIEPPVTDSHGNAVTERVASITYTASTPLPDGYRDTFELSLQLPDTPGATLAFPTIQTCAEGESAWIEVPTDGQDPAELELPAPSVEVTAPGAGGHDAAGASVVEPAADGATSSAPTGAVGAVTAARSADGRDDGVDPLAVAAFGLGALGAALGALAVVRQRRET